MKVMDCVEVLVEKPKYAREGVHKGMQGVVWELVILLPQCGEKEDIADIYMKEEDLKLIPAMSATVNELLKARFEAPEQNKKAKDASDYTV